MRRATKWTSWTLGLALACAPAALAAEQPATQDRPAKSTAGKAKAVDYVVEIPAEDETPEAESSDAAPSYDPNEEGSGYDPSQDPVQPLEDQYSAEPAEPAEQDGESEVIKERFPNGNVKIERETTQDAQGNYVNHGSWKMWDERGNLVAQGQYDLGNRTGTWVRWYRSVSDAAILSKMPYQQFAGPFISQATFKNDLLDGLWTIYDAKMRKISQWSFVDGKRQGPSVWWYSNGKKMREANFENGDMDGEYLEWAPDGAVRVKETYQAGRKLALKTSYHSGNAKKSEGTYLFAKDTEHSPDDWWTCKLITTIKSGKDEKHGHWISWYQNGQKQLEGDYEHDVQVGQFTWWHANGQKALRGGFDRGKQDGTWTWWHANGQKSIEGQYVNGNPTGRWTWWKEDGRVVQSADLSHSEGVVIETPRKLENDAPDSPRVGKPPRRQPVAR